ncbi:MAG: cupredoxin family copper-binding protein [Acidimicrobiia bacterium]|nr:cupredoxin family copper-binding protein [Acidimicrobiia bacterium]MDH5420287.1 cupredoxin family copper-binding protein [Acidimicrobiia bacterium]
MVWKRIVMALAVLSLLAVSCTTSDGEPSDSNTSSSSGANVTIDNFVFGPSSLEVSVGTEVTWTNKQGSPHTITADDGLFASDTVAKDGSFSFTFATPGTYPYHCEIHPNMTGTITVSG